MDHVMIEEKLESLRRCVTRVHEGKPTTAQALKLDVRTREMLVLNLTRAVQVCLDISSHVLSDSGLNAPHTMAEVFAGLQALGVIAPDTCEAMQKSVGFRNLAIHQYESLDWEIVWEICDNGTKDLRQFAREVSAFLDETPLDETPE